MTFVKPTTFVKWSCKIITADDYITSSFVNLMSAVTFNLLSSAIVDAFRYCTCI